ncbi:hypothetical protein H5410_023748 [Solanum commersonii]|uniref:Uncharacterized protein n=1 Tax=Solanum commersonii TaxID=4109 RepID=A0A9J5ZHR2_SOLCO|nr:hypothetical protein H5410_023748 [Solanum commersonii]
MQNYLFRTRRVKDEQGQQMEQYQQTDMVQVYDQLESLHELQHMNLLSLNYLHQLHPWPQHLPQVLPVSQQHFDVLSLQQFHAIQTGPENNHKFGRQFHHVLTSLARHAKAACSASFSVRLSIATTLLSPIINKRHSIANKEARPLELLTCLLLPLLIHCTTSLAGLRDSFNALGSCLRNPSLSEICLTMYLFRPAKSIVLHRISSSEREDDFDFNSSPSSSSSSFSTSSSSSSSSSSEGSDSKDGSGSCSGFGFGSGSGVGSVTGGGVSSSCIAESIEVRAESMCCSRSVKHRWNAKRPSESLLRLAMINSGECFGCDFDF